MQTDFLINFLTYYYATCPAMVCSSIICNSAERLIAENARHILQHITARTYLRIYCLSHDQGHFRKRKLLQTIHQYSSIRFLAHKVYDEVLLFKFVRTVPSQKNQSLKKNELPVR
jgi:hypothetical protein